MSASTPTFATYLALIKYRLLALVLVSTCMGFYLSYHAGTSLLLLLYTLLGVTLVGGGANTLNQWKERNIDALMKRTSKRPLVAGNITPAGALTFGLIITAVGLLILALLVNQLTLILSFLSWLSYLFIYTPLKTRTPFNTWVGGVPGALPAMLGCTAASGQIDQTAIALFLILYVWQIPHFLAISWVYRDDYLRGGFRMLSWNDPEGIVTARQILLHSILLLPVSAGLYLSQDMGFIYLFTALLSGLISLAYAIQFQRQPEKLRAKKVFHFSIIYLPILFLGMILDTLVQGI